MKRRDAPIVKPAFWKGVLFRAAAVSLGLIPLLLCESALYLLDLGRPTDIDDPFVGFSDIHPLFVASSQSGRYEIPVSRRTHFEPESFLVKKPPDEFRIFVLGGSTVQGRPWSIDTSFTTWLELSLQAADPSRRWEVINCGGISYATYRLLPILQEVLAYDPDLIIFCEGHNEFLEDRTYAGIKTAPAVIAWPQRQIAGLRTCTLMRQGWFALRGQQPGPLAASRVLLGPEADARLDWKGGLAQYRRDEQWQADVMVHFAHSLRRMIHICHEAEVPLVFVSPVSNLQWPPFKSQHRDGLPESQQRAFASLFRQAQGHYATDLPRALALLRRAEQIDGQHAQVHYEIGICCRELRLWDEAHESLLAAKELDVCPLRMLEPMRKQMRDIARQTRTPLLDAHALVASHSRSGFPDNQWLVDHVHPSVEGHQLLAGALLAQLTKLQIVAPTAGWEERRELAFEQHLAQLGHAYYMRGQERLDAEQGWARGLIERQRPTSAKPQ